MKFLSQGTPEEKHRLIILTDMENEPDDAQTMVKLLMYSNELDIEGLIATTSRWLPNLVFPESIADRVRAFGIVRKNLIKHAPGWPTEEYLLSKVAGGQRGYGMKAAGDGKSSEGSELIIKAVDKDDPRPVWFAVNAGANTCGMFAEHTQKNAGSLLPKSECMMIGAGQCRRLDLPRVSGYFRYPKQNTGVWAVWTEREYRTAAMGTAESVLLG